MCRLKVEEQDDVSNNLFYCLIYSIREVEIKLFYDLKVYSSSSLSLSIFLLYDLFFLLFSFCFEFDLFYCPSSCLNDFGGSGVTFLSDYLILTSENLSFEFVFFLSEFRSFSFTGVYL
jgi:hypothetical protein